MLCCFDCFGLFNSSSDVSNTQTNRELTVYKQKNNSEKIKKHQLEEQILLFANALDHNRRKCKIDLDLTCTGNNFRYLTHPGSMNASIVQAVDEIKQAMHYHKLERSSINSIINSISAPLLQKIMTQTLNAFDFIGSYDIQSLQNGLDSCENQVKCLSNCLEIVKELRNSVLLAERIQLFLKQGENLYVDIPVAGYLNVLEKVKFVLERDINYVNSSYAKDIIFDILEGVRQEIVYCKMKLSQSETNIYDRFDNDILYRFVEVILHNTSKVYNNNADILEALKRLKKFIHNDTYYYRVENCICKIGQGIEMNFYFKRLEAANKQKFWLNHRDSNDPIDKLLERERNKKEELLKNRAKMLEKIDLNLQKLEDNLYKMYVNWYKLYEGSKNILRNIPTRQNNAANMIEYRI